MAFGAKRAFLERFAGASGLSDILNEGAYAGEAAVGGGHRGMAGRPIALDGRIGGRDTANFAVMHGLPAFEKIAVERFQLGPQLGHYFGDRPPEERPVT